MDHISITDVRCNPGDSAFLIDDGETSILYDTGFGFTGFTVAKNIESVLKDRKLDFIFLTHSHYDHALGSAYVLRYYPEAKVVAHEYAAQVFRRPGAIETMKRLDAKNAAQNGISDYEFLGNELKVDIPCKDKDIIQAGSLQFEVLGLPGHTRDCVGYYCRDQKLFLSCETLGVYDGDRTITSSFLVGYESSIKAIERVSNLEIENLVIPHYGLLTSKQTEFFLSNMKQANEDVAKFISDQIRGGRTTEEIIESYKGRFWHGNIRKTYPIDALKLNTSIMVELLRKENPTF